MTQDKETALETIKGIIEAVDVLRTLTNLNLISTEELDDSLAILDNKTETQVKAYLDSLSEEE